MVIDANVMRLSRSMFEYLLEHQSSTKSEIMEALNITERQFDKIRGLLRRKKMVIKRWTEDTSSDESHDGFGDSSIQGERLTAVYEVPRNLLDFKRVSPERFAELLE